MPYKFKGKRDCTQSDGSKGKYQTVKKDGSKRCYKTEKQYKAAQAYAHETEDNEDIITELRSYIRMLCLMTEGYSGVLWRSSNEEFLQNLLANGSIESSGKEFVSISLDPGSGGQDKYGDVTMQLDFDQVMSRGGIEVDYEDPDFWEAFPAVAKHVTGYMGEDDYLDQGADETTGQTFQEYAEDFYEEQEVVVPRLERDAIMNVSSKVPLSQETLDLLAQYDIPVKL